MTLLSLVIHSFSIISVFKYSVFLRSTFMIIILSFLTKIFSNLIAMLIALGLFGIFLTILIAIPILFFEEKIPVVKKDSILVFDLSVNIMDSPRNITAFELIEETIDVADTAFLEIKSME